jgi:hypothetical protein
MKIIQLTVALNDQGEESLYALADDGAVLQRRWASKPRKTANCFVDGWTEGWILMSDQFSEPIKHADDTGPQP